jgi:tetratricopeptide (TPR) repeat protein
MPSTIPTVKEIAWLSVVPQLAVMATLIALASLTLRADHAVFAGAATYLLLSQLLRRTITADHRRGVRLLRSGELEAAIAAFERSYDFLSHHSWLDRFRYLTLLSSSAYSYREMALCNIAFAHAQLGRADQSIAWYSRALREFPNCALAKTSLAFAAALQASPVNAVTPNPSLQRTPPG